MSWWQSFFKEEGSIDITDASFIIDDSLAYNATPAERLVSAVTLMSMLRETDTDAGALHARLTIALAHVGILQTALHSADADVEALHVHVQQLEEEWSGKMGDYMQRNAQLRVDAKQAGRRAAAAEAAVEAKDAEIQRQQQAAEAASAALEHARKRIGELEQGLEDAVLGSDDHFDAVVDAAVGGKSSPSERGSAGELPAVELGTPVASLGTGHGGVDLTPLPTQGAREIMMGDGPATQPSAEMEINADDLLADGRADYCDADAAAAADAAEALAAEKAAAKAVEEKIRAAQPNGVVKIHKIHASPPRLTLHEERGDAPEDVMVPELPISKPPKGGCCVVS